MKNLAKVQGIVLVLMKGKEERLGQDLE